MKIITEEAYHIYNQGNNKETIFYDDADYREFLNLFREFVLPRCKVLAYCLMPNHFHFLIYATEYSAKTRRVGNVESCELANGFRLLQSNYAQYINKKQNRSGSLFRQKTKSKAMREGDENYEFIAFQYIHQNPLKAGLVTKLEDWQYSSFVDYMGLRRGSICDKELAFVLVGFDKDNFYKESYQDIDENWLNNIFVKKKKI